VNTILSVLKNKYFLVTVAFLVWIFFFAEYDVISQFRQRNELREMKARIQYLEGEIERLQAEKFAIQSDSNTLERYAREKYFMKSKNEDVFVFDTVSKPLNNVKTPQ
jgi:cell division protein FtsB